MEVTGRPIKVSGIYPGYIGSEMNARAERTPMITDTVTGVRRMVSAIERERGRAVVPAWPWAPIARFDRPAPLGPVRRTV